MMRGNNYSVKWIIMRSTCRIFVVYLRRQETRKVDMSIELQLGEVEWKQRGGVAERFIYLPRVY
jgi:hypothetical protein